MKIRIKIETSNIKQVKSILKDLDQKGEVDYFDTCWVNNDGTLEIQDEQIKAKIAKELEEQGIRYITGYPAAYNQPLKRWMDEKKPEQFNQREHAALQLRVAKSENPELDQMIRDSIISELFQKILVTLPYLEQYPSDKINQAFELAVAAEQHLDQKLNPKRYELPGPLPE